MTPTPPGSGALVLGGDVGGTSTRIVVADLAGREVSRATGPGGNPVAHPATAVATFAEVVGEALAGVDAGAVRAGVVGMAGSGAVRDPQVRAAYDESWRAAGLHAPLNVCSDLEVAFAAGDASGTGSVLIAGTGAVAGRLEDHRLAAAVGGHGWLLGDEGSGFWIGREAVRATLRWLEGTGADGDLVRGVLAHLGVAGHGAAARTALVAAAYERPPVGLSSLSPVVARAHEAGDPTATVIVEAAVDHLVDCWERLGGRGVDPLVLAGSLTGADSPVGGGLQRRLAARGVTVVAAVDPVAGAVRLAVRAAGASGEGN